MIKRDSKRIQRHKRLRTKIRGTLDRPRLSIFRSNRHISVQLVDDVAGLTLASTQDTNTTTDGKKPQEVAFVIGEEIAKKAQEKKITKVVFDRAGHRYHGRVKALAEGARKGGLEF